MKGSMNKEDLGSVRVDIVMDQLKKLDKNERILIGLYFYEQLSIEEIAVILSIDERDIREQLYRVLPKLRFISETEINSNTIFSEVYG